MLKKGLKFRIKETGHIICLASLPNNKGSITFDYLCCEKPPFTTNEKEVKRMVSFQRWIKIEENNA